MNEYRLYIAGRTPKSKDTIQKLKKVLQDNNNHRFRLVVIDLLMNPEKASADNIIATPTLVRVTPLPIRKIVGDLAGSGELLRELNLWEKKQGCDVRQRR